MAVVRFNQDQEPRNELRPVVTRNEVSTENKSLGKRFLDSFLSPAAYEIGSYLKRMVIDYSKQMMTDALNMALYGDDRKSRARTARMNDSYRYNAFYQSEVDDRYGAPPRRSYDRYISPSRTDYRHIVINFNDKLPYPQNEFYARDRAEEIVSILKGRIKTYKSASVADLLELANLPTARDGVDRNIGWTDPRDIDTMRVSDGYLILVTDADKI